MYCEWQLHRHNELNFGLTKFDKHTALPSVILILIMSPASFLVLSSLFKFFCSNSELLSFLTVWSWLLPSLFPFLLWFTWFIPRELKTWRKAFRNWIVLPFPTGGAHLVFCALLTTLYRKWSFWCLSRTVPYISKGLYLAFFDSVLLWGRFCSADPPLI